LLGGEGESSGGGEFTSFSFDRVKKGLGKNSEYLHTEKRGRREGE